MKISQEALDSLYQVASERIQSVGVDSPEELFNLWKLLNPAPDEQAEIDAAIRRGIDDMNAGRHRPAREATEEIRQRHGIVRQSPTTPRRGGIRSSHHSAD
jgi:hypothetical protein